MKAACRRRARRFSAERVGGQWHGLIGAAASRGEELARRNTAVLSSLELYQKKATGSLVLVAGNPAGVEFRFLLSAGEWGLRESAKHAGEAPCGLWAESSASVRVGDADYVRFDLPAEVLETRIREDAQFVLQTQEGPFALKYLARAHLVDVLPEHVRKAAGEGIASW